MAGIVVISIAVTGVILTTLTTNIVVTGIVLYTVLYCKLKCKHTGDRQCV